MNVYKGIERFDERTLVVTLSMKELAVTSSMKEPVVIYFFKTMKY